MTDDWFMEAGEEDTGYQGRCNSRLRGPSEGRCVKQSGWGTDHLGLGPCKLHGGGLPSVGMSARLRAAGQLAIKFGAPREQFTDPRDALMELHQRLLGRVDLLTMIVQQLELEQIAGLALTSVRSGERPAGQSGDLVEHWETVETVGVSIWVQMLDTAEDRLGRVAAEIVKLGLLQRAIEVEAGVAAMLGQAVTNTLDEMGLDANQRSEAQLVLARHLREIEAEAQRTPPGIGRGNPHR